MKKKKSKMLTKVNIGSYAQNGIALPNANASAPRKLKSAYQPINPQLAQNNIPAGMAYAEQNYAPTLPYEEPQQISPQLAGNMVPDTGMDVDYYNNQLQGPQKQRKSYNGWAGQTALTGLLAVDALLPNQNQPSPVVKPGLSYNEHPYGTGSSALMKDGGWIKKAINPAHKGWCTPLSNPHCTGHRRALALRFKHGDLHKGENGLTVSNDGYKANSKDFAQPMLRIPSSDITMEGVPFPVYGEDEYGNGKMMYPGEHHYFQGGYVDETPMRHMQSGGNVGGTATYKSYDEINRANQFARDFAARKGAPAWLAQNSYVARDIGDPVVQFEGNQMQSTTKLATTLPTGTSVDDVFQTNEGQYGYYNNDSNFVPVDPATIYSLYGKKTAAKPIGSPATSVASFKSGGKMKIYKQGGMLKNYYEKGSVHDLSDNEIQSLISNGYELKFV